MFGTADWVISQSNFFNLILLFLSAINFLLGLGRLRSLVLMVTVIFLFRFSSLFLLMKSELDFSTLNVIGKLEL